MRGRELGVADPHRCRSRRPLHLHRPDRRSQRPPRSRPLRVEQLWSSLCARLLDGACRLQGGRLLVVLEVGALGIPRSAEGLMERPR